MCACLSARLSPAPHAEVGAPLLAAEGGRQTVRDGRKLWGKVFFAHANKNSREEEYSY